ncbi:hypothetical protein HpHA291_12400 [Helicobacter pylori]
MTSLKNCIEIIRSGMKSLSKSDFLHGIITPILHIEGQEEEEDDFEEEIDLE